MDIRAKWAIFLGCLLIIGVLLIVLPISPFNHWHYEGTILVATNEQAEQWKIEYALKTLPDSSEKPIIMLDKIGSTVYRINIDTSTKLNLEGFTTSLDISEIIQDHLWVRVLAGLLISLSLICLVGCCVGDKPTPQEKWWMDSAKKFLLNDSFKATYRDEDTKY